VSLYRQPGQARRRRRVIAACAAAAIVVLAALAVVIAGGGGPPSHAERIAAARSAAGQALDGLELVEIEYGQAVKGRRIVASTEYDAARADVQRAKDALVEHRDDLLALDPGVLARAERSLDDVARAVARRATTGELKHTVAVARAAIEPLAR
jgi:hypothetical protein